MTHTFGFERSQLLGQDPTVVSPGAIWVNRSAVGHPCRARSDPKGSLLSDQRGQGAQIPGREPCRPLWLRQHLLQHEGVDVHHAILEEVQGEHADLVILATVAGHFTATSEQLVAGF